MTGKAGSDWLGKNLAGRYTVIEKLGAGGMGTVFRATDHNLNTDVVVKVPHPSMLQNKEFVKRFAQEVRSLVALSHPHVVSVLDVGEHEGVPFAVMRYLPGGDLKDRQPRNEQGQLLPADPLTLLDWLEDVAKALDFIHSRGFVHRDIKPDNIIFDKAGNAYVGDFGIVKALGTALEKGGTVSSLTQEGVALGTPEYMAPELVMGEKYDGAVDQYSLAATVYEVLCGRPPFQGNTPAAIVVKATTETPPHPSLLVPGISGDIAECLLKALSRNPQDRYHSCGTFARKLLRRVKRHAAQQGTSELTFTDSTLRKGQTKGEAGRSSPTDPAAPPALATPPPIAVRARTVECPSCHHQFSATPLAGRTIICARCGKTFAPQTDREQLPGSPTVVEKKDTSPGVANTVPQPPPVKPRPKKQAPSEAAKTRRRKSSSRGKQSDAEATSLLSSPPASKKPERKDRSSAGSRPTRVEPEPPTLPAKEIGLAYDDKSPTPTPTVPHPDARRHLPKKQSREQGRSVTKASLQGAERAATPQPPGRRRHPGWLVVKILAALLLIAAMSVPVVYLWRSHLRQQDIVVAAEGGGDYESLSEAVENAPSGSRIVIRKGRYRLSRLVLDKPLTLRGENRDDVVLEISSAILISHKEVHLTDVTVKGLSADKEGGSGKTRVTHRPGRRPFLPFASLQLPGGINTGGNTAGKTQNAPPENSTEKDDKPKAARAAVRITDGTPTLENCRITSEDGSGIVVEGKGTRPVIRNCNIHDCKLSGIYFTNAGTGRVEGCHLEKNRFAGIYVNGGDPEITKCRITGNQLFGIRVPKGTPLISQTEIAGSKYGGVSSDGKSEVTLRNCEIHKGDKDGLRIFGDAKIYDCKIHDNKGDGLLGGFVAEILLRNCTISNQGNMGCYVAGKIRIESCTISGITNNGIEIASKTGQATITNTQITDVKKTGIGVFGIAQIENCTISRAGSRGIEVSSKSPNTTIRGTKVLQAGEIGIAVFGKARLQNNCEIRGCKKYGLYVHEAGATAHVNQTTITKNEKEGVMCFGTLTLDNSTITENKAAGIKVQIGGNATLQGNCRIENNSGRGVWVFGKATVDRCQIKGNGTAGVSVYGGSATVINCHITGHSSYGVYAGYATVGTDGQKQYGHVTVKNCDLRGNKNSHGKWPGASLVESGNTTD